MSLKKVLNEEVIKGKKLNIFKALISLYSDPSLRAIFLYRLSKMYYDKGKKRFAKILRNKITTTFSSYISLQAEIGKNLEFRHMSGVVIGDGVKIGEGVIIYQQVTLGGQNLGDSKKGNYPIICDNVTIFSGAKVLGSVQIGENSIIGANSVVIKDVPPNSIVAGVPAKVIKSGTSKH
ncbi:serine O-acetyltransferase EpsC [Halalkalibacter sp. AB-rgal2]|uniref:serine O-acetyltransferase EpsC n=1 Tax=Halalkalibacter sp. AB-rgal2 TaxID=3242695 RepID=UPI00359EEB9F